MNMFSGMKRQSIQVEHFIIAHGNGDAAEIIKAAKALNVKYTVGVGPKCTIYIFNATEIEWVKEALLQARDEASLPLEGNIFLRSFNYEQDAQRRRYKGLVALCNTNRLGTIPHEQKHADQTPEGSSQPSDE